jgi:uncharacterized protein (TIGR04255 family)
LLRHSDLRREFSVSNGFERDELLLNWRRSEPATQRYPSYETTRPAFEGVMRQFVRFVEEQALGSFKPNQCEVTYVNHIAIDLDCRSPGEMFARCFPGLSAVPSDEFLPRSPERGRYACSYRIPDNRGRLHVEMRTARLIKTAQDVFDLRLTARGAPASGTIDAVLEWLNLGHEWVVRGFKSFTSPAMHQRWEIQS